MLQQQHAQIVIGYAPLLRRTLEEGPLQPAARDGGGAARASTAALGVEPLLESALRQLDAGASLLHLR